MPEFKQPEKESSASEQRKHFKMENAPAPEKKEIPEADEKLIALELRRELELMELDGKLKSEADKEKQKIEFLGEKEKIEHLLQSAREKGVIFAVQLAKKMNDPYLLDVLHDALAREGFYLKLGQQNDDQQIDDNQQSKT